MIPEFLIQELSMMENRIISARDLEEFVKYLRREEKSEKTVEKYDRDLRHFLAFLEGRELTKEQTLAYKRYLIEKNYAVRSINSMLAAINSMLTYMGREDCKVKSLRCQRQAFCSVETELTKAEYLRLLDASKGQVKINLIVQTICATGIRISELSFFTVEMVRCGTVSVNCKNKTRTILVPGKLKKQLLNYARKYGISSGVIFRTKNGKPMDRSNIWAQMKRLCAAANVNPDKVYPHNLRKLFARTFYEIEKDIAKLADILGHSSIETTRIYIITTGTEHLRKIERLGLLL